MHIQMFKVSYYKLNFKSIIYSTDTYKEFIHNLGNINVSGLSKCDRLSNKNSFGDSNSR